MRAAKVSYIFPITLGAFLLFQIQPMTGKYILPWFGGSSAVWSTCLVFFQTLLFGGYLYAHLVGTRLTPRRQGLCHILLLVLSLLLLPWVRNERWQPAPGDSPTLLLLVFLTATIGLPYLVLSSSSPLLQRWYSLREPGTPYRLYAFSNFGSLLGLLSYPFVVEPLLPLGLQEKAWSVAYLLFASSSIYCAYTLLKGQMADPARSVAPPARQRTAAPMPAAALILALAMCGSLLMAATTHALCEDIGAIPLLWVVPLALYLLSFIITFARDSYYRRSLFLSLFALSTVSVIYTLVFGGRLGLWWKIALLSANLFAAAMVCHGEAARLKPEPGRLTAFYLILAAGGALGTAFVVFAAPFLFHGYWELHVGIAACWALLMAAQYRESLQTPRVKNPVGLWWLRLTWLVLLVAVLRYHTLLQQAGVIRGDRNFYGVLQVLEQDRESPTRHRYELKNGGILHGAQFVDPERRRVPTAYYGFTSGMALALEEQRNKRPAGGPDTLRIGAVGLGVGVLAAYGREGDTIRFYELNPAVLRVAESDFSFLQDSAAAIEVVLGDARISLNKELTAEGPRMFDLLVVDAFTGGAIPLHLLTRECFDLYSRHLSPGGKIAVNISNRYLDLRPVVMGQVREAGWKTLFLDSARRLEDATNRASWALISPGGDDFSSREREASARSRPLFGLKPVVWTDDYSNIFRVLEGIR